MVTTCVLAGIPGSPLSPRLPSGAEPLLVFEWVARSIGATRLTPTGQGAIAMVTFAVGATAFLPLIWRAWRGWISARAVLVCGIGLHALAWLLPVLGSHDVFHHAMYGRMAGLYGANPYATTPGDFPSDPALAFVDPTYHDTRAPYGPAYLYLTGVFARLFPDLADLVLALKAVTAAAGVLTTLLVYRLASRLRPERAGFAVALFGCNPMVLFGVVAGGHNDPLIALAVTGALAVLVAAWRNPSGPDLRLELVVTGLLTLAAMIKVPGLVPLGLFVVASVAKRPPGRRFLVLLAHALVAAGLAGVLSARFVGKDMILALLGQGGFRTYFAPSRFVGNVLSAVGRVLGAPGAGAEVSFGVLLAFVFAYLWALSQLVARLGGGAGKGGSLDQGRAWGLALLTLALATPLVLPWYLVWGLPLVWLLPRAASLAAVGASSVLALATSVVPEPPFATAYRVLTTIGEWILAPALLVVLLVLGYHMVRRPLSDPATPSGAHTSPGHPMDPSSTLVARAGD